MESITNLNYESISLAYTIYYNDVYRFMIARLHSKMDAEDLAQDVFIRLMDYQAMLRSETVKSFLFTIARNILNDYLRRYYKKQEIDTYFYAFMQFESNETEEQILRNDLMQLEINKLSTFPPQRKMIYSLRHDFDYSAKEIAEQLSLSVRTVENHLFIANKEMRNYIKQCV